jgi:hypothetical protein
MDTRLTTTHGRLLTATIVALALVMALEATSTSAAKSATCSVKNADTGRTYPRLQQAVDAAKPGARLDVKGVCHGGTFIDRSIAIGGVLDGRTGRPVLTGDDKARVLVVAPSAKVSLRDLVIRDGLATRIADGGGISNKGKLTLRDVTVRHNDATRGAGIYNEGVLQTRGRSVVVSNGDIDRSLGGSGVHNLGRLTLDDRTRIQSNKPVVNEGTLVMRGMSSISHSLLAVGTIGLYNDGSLTMQDSSSISDQGPVSNAGTLVMNDASSIHDNLTSGCVHALCGPSGSPGAGVHNTGTLTMNDASSIHHNRVGGPATHQPPTAPGARGGGVYNAGTVVMSGSSRIRQNEAMNGGNGVPGLGGGLYNARGGILVGIDCGGNVHGNTPDDCYFEP